MLTHSFTSNKQNTDNDQPVIPEALAESDPELAGILADLAKLKKECVEDYQLLIQLFN